MHHIKEDEIKEIKQTIMPCYFCNKKLDSASFKDIRKQNVVRHFKRT